MHSTVGADWSYCTMHPTGDVYVLVGADRITHIILHLFPTLMQHDFLALMSMSRESSVSVIIFVINHFSIAKQLYRIIDTTDSVADTWNNLDRSVSINGLSAQCT